MKLKPRNILVAFVALFGLVVLVISALAFTDYYDPAPVETLTPTCEPIGAQHPRSPSADCTREGSGAL